MATSKPTGRASINDALLELGFVFDADATTEAIDSAADLQRGGPYDFRGCYRKGPLTITVEQNTDTRLESGMTQMTTYPEIAIVDGPKGRVACPVDDLDLITRMASELA